MDWMLDQILRRHSQGTLDGGIPNPSLEEMCAMLARAGRKITCNVQRRSFQLTGVTVAVDGSEDHLMSPELKELLNDHGQDLQLRSEDLARFTTRPDQTISKVFQLLCGDAPKLQEEEFCLDPPMAASQTKKRARRYD